MAGGGFHVARLLMLRPLRVFKQCGFRARKYHCATPHPFPRIANSWKRSDHLFRLGEPPTVRIAAGGWSSNQAEQKYLRHEDFDEYAIRPEECCIGKADFSIWLSSREFSNSNEKNKSDTIREGLEHCHHILLPPTKSE